MNAKLKGMLRVNCKTPLPHLFETLEYAASEIDRKAVISMQELDAQFQRQAYKETFPALIHPHISRYAQKMVQEQFNLSHNYRVFREVKDGVNIFHVQRPARNDTKRVVKATMDTIECSCCFPATYLLPCRHVICLNLELMLTPFLPTQVGKRWLRSYKPPRDYKFILLTPPPLESSSLSPSLPSFLSNAMQAGPRLTRKHRWGELTGIFKTAADRGADDAEAYSDILQWSKELLRRILDRTSAPASAPLNIQGEQQQQPQQPEALTRLTSLHPSLTIGEARAPPKPKKKRHREEEKRRPSQGERK